MAYKGKLFLIKVSNGEVTPIPETFTVVGGFRTNSLTINNEQVDITDKDGTMWKKLLEGAGVQSMSAKGSGVYKDNAKTKVVMAAAVANSILRYQLVSESGESFTGPFAISSVERAGEFNKEETFSFSFESGGDIVYDDGVV